MRKKTYVRRFCLTLFRILGLESSSSAMKNYKFVLIHSETGCSITDYYLWLTIDGREAVLLLRRKADSHLLHVTSQLWLCMHLG